MTRSPLSLSLLTLVLVACWGSTSAGRDIVQDSFRLTLRIIDVRDQTPLVSASVRLTDADNRTLFSGYSDREGRATFEKVPPGRYQLDIDHLGYEMRDEATPVESITIQLRDQDLDLTIPMWQTVISTVPIELRARRPSRLLGRAIPISTLESTAAVFSDPARLIALEPDIVQTNDQANHLSVRGNSPNKNIWRINGLAIVNPNHTANAGTSSDAPTLSGGGVNALSPQLLYNSRFYASGLPANYGSALGGTFAMELRPGGMDQRRLRTQASFIGIDLTAEGHLQKDNSFAWSYLATYRYSFTGLLADLGADFGGEEIRFQDAGLHLHKWTRSGGAISVFGLYGQSSNEFSGPRDPQQRSEEKDLYDIDFNADLVVGSVRWQESLGRPNHLFSLGAAYSQTNPDRRQRGIDSSQFNSSFDLRQRRLNLQASLQLDNTKLGLDILHDDMSLQAEAPPFGAPTPLARDTTATRWAAFASQTLRAGKFHATMGFQTGLFGSDFDDAFFDPRLLVHYRFDSHTRLFISAEQISHLPLENLLADDTYENRTDQVVRNQRLELGLQNWNGLGWSASLFAERTPDEDAVRSSDFLVGRNNQLALSPPQPTQTDHQIASRRYGATGQWQTSLSKNIFAIAGSLFRAESRQLDNTWTADRWDYGWTARLRWSRGWIGNIQKGRISRRGVQLALIARGGERFPQVFNPDRPVLPGEDPARGAYDYSDGFSDRMSTYFRPDIRLYRRVSRDHLTTTLALDIQNVAGIQNEFDRYYDDLLDKVVTRYQLGLIPVLSYKLEWQ